MNFFPFELSLAEPALASLISDQNPSPQCVFHTKPNAAPCWGYFYCTFAASFAAAAGFLARVFLLR